MIMTILITIITMIMKTMISSYNIDNTAKKNNDEDNDNVSESDNDSSKDNIKNSDHDNAETKKNHNMA